jgi:dTDP-4-amino-4,6-dideoxygalactose transaminase
MKPALTTSRSELAVFGGPPVLPEPLPVYQGIGPEERRAVDGVMASGALSAFYGVWGDRFRGGPEVLALEQEWNERFGVRNAVAVNSATSGLVAALGAVGVGPGDEVIVPPYTMSATAIAPIAYGGVPVFADIEEDTFCIDPASVEAAITPRTKAIVAVNLFGHPAQLERLSALARAHGLRLVEDCAQAPFASENGRLAGTVGDIGVFSLNYHKHFHAGEGGICVTNDDELALRLQLIRNHGENAVAELGLEDLSNLVGFNLRPTELGAAIARVQLRDADRHVERAERLAAALTEALDGLDGLTAPVVRDGCRHVFYIWAARFDERVVGVSRELFSAALAAEGFPHFRAYVRPLYRLPLFQRRVAIGPDGFPFTLTGRTYDDVDCPVVERVWEKELIGFDCCGFDVDEAARAQLCEAIRKVHAGREELASRGVDAPPASAR